MLKRRIFLRLKFYLGFLKTIFQDRFLDISVGDALGSMLFLYNSDAKKNYNFLENSNKCIFKVIIINHVSITCFCFACHNELGPNISYYSTSQTISSALCFVGALTLLLSLCLRSILVCSN